jgi:hypothetical protein
MGLRPTQGDEKRLGLATTFHVIDTSPLSVHIWTLKHANGRRVGGL